MNVGNCSDAQTRPDRGKCDLTLTCLKIPAYNDSHGKN